MSKLQQLEDLYAEMAKCERCPRLVQTRTHVVRWRGDPEAARIVGIGEAPGEQEDTDGEAFKGKAGKLLDKMVGKLESKDESQGATEEDFIWFNTVACRPTQENKLTDPPRLENSTPTAAEIANCRPWVERFVRIIDPVAIILLGERACLGFGLKGAIGKLRGQMVDVVIKGIERPVIYCAMPVWHPAYLLRTTDKPQFQEQTEADLRAVVERAWAYLRVAQGMSPVATEV